MQTMFAKAMEVARDLHNKNQANINSANLDPSNFQLLQEISRSTVIGVLEMVGVDKATAVQIVDEQIIGNRKPS